MAGVAGHVAFAFVGGWMEGRKWREEEEDDDVVLPLLPLLLSSSCLSV